MNLPSKYNFAVTLRSTSELIGAIGLMLNLEYEMAEMGYWIGKPFGSKAITLKLPYKCWLWFSQAKTQPHIRSTFGS